MYKVSKIETSKGTYWVVLDTDNHLYGISNIKVESMHCAYASLSALFTAKGI